MQHHEDGSFDIAVAMFTATVVPDAKRLYREMRRVVRPGGELLFVNHFAAEGGLREDEFSGGYSLRIRQVWDYAQLCQQHAQRLQLRLDLRVPGLWQRVDALLSRHRPGGTWACMCMCTSMCMCMCARHWRGAGP